MSADSAGYVTEVAYMPGFYEHMVPLALRYAASVNNVAAPHIHVPFRYLELGCGLGQTVTTCAAANPLGEFVGVDVNEEHVAIADKAVKTGGLSNCQILRSDFATLSDKLGSQQFDFIAAHGVLSWVAPEVQQQLLAIAEQHLKPNGLFLVSYNALPGWSHLAPIREMIRRYIATKSGSPIEKMDAALRYLTYISDRKSEYFTRSQTARAHVQNLMRQDRRYLVHEYLNEHWRAFYFHEVADMCRPHGLRFIGGLPIVTNYWDMCVAPELHELFQTTTDRDVIETHKDFCMYGMFRWDIYSKTPHPIATLTDRLQATDTIHFSMNDLRVPYHVHLGGGAMEINGPEYELLQTLLAEKSRTLRELVESSGLPEQNWPALVRALDRGFATGFANISAQPFPLKQAIDEPLGQYTFTNAYNRAVVERTAFSGEHAVVASAVTGGGHVLKEFDAGIALALANSGPDNLVESVDALMTAKKRTLKQGSTIITDPVRRQRILQPLCTDFIKTVLPELVQLNVLQKVIP